jgi:hypothetical protein
VKNQTNISKNILEFLKYTYRRINENQNDGFDFYHAVIYSISEGLA